MGIVIIEDEEKAWFPGAELAEFHGLTTHHATPIEKLLFGFRDDGSEGICCPTGGEQEPDEEEED